ncbi:hypothetical protein LJC64_02245 [Ruminococcaceae bacterium OttesenSCG-928-A11]|nr:hypothetical protein [Ruminococcaceae bacterium OttesenSCG-928-A11]
MLKASSKTLNNKLLVFITIVIFFLLSLISMALLSSTILFNPTPAQADNQSSLNSEFEVEIEEVLAFSLTNCDNSNSSVLSINITPNSSGVFKSNCQTTTVDTNAPGYSLSVHQNNGLPPEEETTTETGTVCNTGYNDAYDGDDCKDDEQNIICKLYDINNPGSNDTISSVPIDCVSNYDDVVSSSATPDVICQYLTFGNDAGSCTGETTTTTTTYSTDLAYQNPTTIDPKPTIPSTSNIIASPNILANNTWGFAVEGNNNFDTTYTIDNANNKFAQLPTDDTTIYSTTQGPIQGHTNTFYYGTKLTTATMAGTYATTVTYTAVGTPVMPPQMNCEKTGKSPECIVFTVDLTTAQDNTYSIPTSGRVSTMDHTYNWDVYVDGYLTSACSGGNCTGTSGTGLPGAAGIVLTNLSNNQHQILIVPHDDPIPGWGNAFGYYNNTSGANTDVNKNKLVSLDAPLTTMAFAPKTTESSTNASYMFAYTFSGCINQVNTIVVIDTYKLPDTIINLSLFMAYVHSGNQSISSPIDLTPLTNWLNNNNSIKEMSMFFYSSHSGNPNIQSPIDLNPISGWFNHNNSIVNLTDFFRSVHASNTNIRSPIDLAPISDWFDSNNSVVEINGFFKDSHSNNINLQYPISLHPISDWFNYNTSIYSISHFFSGTHYNNTSLQLPIDFTQLSKWFLPNRLIPYHYVTLSDFLYRTHYNNTSLVLNNQRLLPSWMKTLTNQNNMKYVWNTNNSFYRTFYMSDNKDGDTGEIRFEDGTVLSSVGTPETNREIYTNRSGIAPVNSNWK